MRWIAILALFLVLTGSAKAAGSDEQYLDIYNEILQADGLLQSGHSNTAAAKYLQAQADLQKLHQDRPSWNPDIVQFRLDYLADKLQSLAKFLPATNAPPAGEQGPVQSSSPVQPAVVPPPSVSMEPSVAALTQQNAGLQAQIHSLSDANAELQGKLKEALSVQPAAVSPDELAKAQARITMLQKERDLLAVALDQEKAASASAVAAARAAVMSREVAALKARADADEKRAQEEVAQAKAAAAESERKLAAATQELDTLKAARAAEADENAALKARADADEKKSQEEMAQLKEAATESAKMLTALAKELELVKTAHPAEIQISEGAKEIPEERDQMKQQLAEISKDELEITRLKEVVGESEQKLAAANSELDSLKAARPAAAEPADDAKAVSEERDKLKEELAERSKDLADAESHNNQELSKLRAALQQAEQRRDELEKKLAAVPPNTLDRRASQF